ncbi:ASCH domain-containing protein [Sphingomonas koreensis]
MDPSVPRLWRRYRETDPSAPADLPVVFHFCDNQPDADSCANLVVAGRKRATASSLVELELAELPVPNAGDLAVITGWSGEAKAVIRTTSVEIRKFRDVDEAFARDEGEGDLTLEWWRDAHRAYYERVLANSGHRVDDDLQIACERFEVVMLA